jgi:hypothetical protein
MNDDFLGTIKVRNGGTLHVASLSRQSIIENEAEHLGFDGFFVFQDVNSGTQQGIKILGKACDYDAGVALAELLTTD